MTYSGVIPDALAAFKHQARCEPGRFLESELAHAEVRRILAEGDPAETVQHAEALGAIAGKISPPSAGRLTGPAIGVRGCGELRSGAE
jgi:hypothetical protein